MVASEFISGLWLAALKLYNTSKKCDSAAVAARVDPRYQSLLRKSLERKKKPLSEP